MRNTKPRGSSKPASDNGKPGKLTQVWKAEVSFLFCYLSIIDWLDWIYNIVYGIIQWDIYKKIKKMILLLQIMVKHTIFWRKLAHKRGNLRINVKKTILFIVSLKGAWFQRRESNPRRLAYETCLNSHSPQDVEVFCAGIASSPLCFLACNKMLNLTEVPGRTLHILPWCARQLCSSRLHLLHYFAHWTQGHPIILFYRVSTAAALQDSNLKLSYRACSRYTIDHKGDEFWSRRFQTASIFLILLLSVGFHKLITQTALEFTLRLSCQVGYI